MSETSKAITSRKGAASSQENDEETQNLLSKTENDQKQAYEPKPPVSSKPGTITKTGLKVLFLLAFQNAFKNILMRTVMVGHPKFLLSTAVIVVEIFKLLIAMGYIVLVEKRSPFSLITYMKYDWRNSILLGVPAPCYILQMSLEYIALSNLDPATYAVIVQMKMLTTAFFFRTVLGKKLMKKQIISLFLLTTGVMLCNMSDMYKSTSSTEGKGNEIVPDADAIAARTKGILATCGIVLSSGFASVFTEKVIKSTRKNHDGFNKDEYSLAYMQAQLALVSLILLGVYSFFRDFKTILEKGFFWNYDAAAFLTSVNSAVGGLIVAASLKFADSVLKGYASACSIILTGVVSSILFGTELGAIYIMGVINVCIAVLLYNADSNGMDAYLC
jgi:UDP-sugar transporter A1/2/3